VYKQTKSVSTTGKFECWEIVVDLRFEFDKLNGTGQPALNV
jgi:hypothetical protein